MPPMTSNAISPPRRYCHQAQSRACDKYKYAKRQRKANGPLGEGKLVMLGYLDWHNQIVVLRWLIPVMKRLGDSVILTDDLISYKKVAEKLDLEHQICQFHVLR